jgi:hypothetical protein
MIKWGHQVHRISPQSVWLGLQDSNLGMAVPKTAALPLGEAPKTRHVLNLGSGHSSSPFLTIRLSIAIGADPRYIAASLCVWLFPKAFEVSRRNVGV